MPIFLDTQDTVQRFGGSVAEFRSLLDRDHIRHGSPNDLFEFAKTLDESNQFRMDLSALVKSVVGKEREELLLTDMMSIIAAAVGGPSVTDTNADITKPTNTLMEFLLGTGCWNWKQYGSPSRPATQRATPPSVRVEEPGPIRISLPDSPTKPAHDVHNALEDKASLLEISKELRQTLSRLEGNTQQVKLRLDSIERRIGQLESTPNNAPANKLDGLEPLLHHGTADTAVPKLVPPPVREMPASEPPLLPTRGRAIFSGPMFHDVSTEDDDDDFSSPTFAYGTEKRRSIVPIAIFILLAAIGVAIFFFMHSIRGQELVKEGLGRLKGNPSQLSSPPASAPPASGATPSTTSPAATTTTPAAASTTSPPADQHGAGAGVAAAATPSPAATSSSADAGSPNSSDVQPLSNDPKVKYVPANVMEGYLLSAPRPEYPRQARIDHIEGQVALQAIISRSGSIRALHAIKGPASLRSAAVAAVRTWRYKPYSVDGQPQDVATTVYVDFSLNRPPTLVH